MSRFDEAIKRWKKTEDKRKPLETSCSNVVAESDWKLVGMVVSVILLDVVKVVEAYERTIADLKRQNKKARGRAGR